MKVISQLIQTFWVFQDILILILIFWAPEDRTGIVAPLQAPQNGRINIKISWVSQNV